MQKKVAIEALNDNNWLKICDLSVSEEQKTIFQVPNVYWIGISRYEEMSKLFAIKADDDYVGLIGGGYDEDGVTGYINPLMIDYRHQKNGYAKKALFLIITYLRDTLHVSRININHHKENDVAGKLYESLGFLVYGENENEYMRKLEVTQTKSVLVELRKINKENLESVIQLSVSECQESFVSSTAYSLAQAWVYRETAFPFAIYADETLVGFVMLGYYESRRQYTLWKFLIDKHYQNRGYGREALQLAIRYLIETFDVSEIYTGVALKNEVAKHLYNSVGFTETGLIEDNMQEMRYICQKVWDVNR